MNTTTAIDFNTAWQAVCDRDAGQDGSFFFAVRTTGVYCRPSCPARRPRSENVSFYATPEEAERAGFRACLRCRPRDEVSSAETMVTKVRELIESATDEPMRLNELAAALSVSAGHLQRTFKRLTGVSPRQYAEAQRLRRFKDGLRKGEDVASATYGAGFGSGSRVYEKADAMLGMTPGTYRRGGRGMTIGYSLTQSAMGPLLVASTERGVCFVGFAKSESELMSDLRDEYPEAAISGPAETTDVSAAVLAAFLEGRCRDLDLPIDVQGTPFQLLVWQALRSIPFGATRSYRQVAASLEKPTLARGVARACATNPVSLLIPCHRVLTSTGGMSGYRWGIANKRRLLDGERALAGAMANGA